MFIITREGWAIKLRSNFYTKRQLLEALEKLEQAEKEHES